MAAHHGLNRCTFIVRTRHHAGVGKQYLALAGDMVDGIQGRLDAQVTHLARVLDHQSVNLLVVQTGE